MKKTILHSFLTLSLACGLVHGLPQSVAARSVLDVPDLTGAADKPLFRFDIFDKGETSSSERTSQYTLSKEEKNAMRTGTLYWSALLLPTAANTDHLLIEVTTKERRSDNASGGSDISEDGTTELAAALNGRSYAANKPVGRMIIERSEHLSGWYVGAMSSLPQNGIFADLNSTVLHEMGHALGMYASVTDLDSPNPPATGMFGSRLSLWDTHLRDINGNAPKANQIITTDPTVSNGFIVRKNDDNAKHTGVYFAGPAVMGLLTVDGKVAQLAWPEGSTLARVPGLPILGGTDMSHIELQNGLMSHQNYRNWTIFMEAELAAMQDAGLKFDRRNMYGFSVYNDDLTYVNTNPYYARTADGKWIVGQPNATAYGTGFHVYGSNNSLRQAADLLSSGAYGIGIRMDGSGNTLTIDPNVRVQASGFGGIGLAVAYGKDHSIIQRGTLSAMGEGGIGARFDFGDNSMGNDTEYRGSWQRSDKDDAKLALRDALEGPLVKSFDVTGVVEGKHAAIFIGRSGLVENINIMGGARLQGNIVSDWDIHNPLIQYTGDRKNLITNLTFGLKADALGKATTVADSAFALRYNGNISAAKGMNFTLAGGTLSFYGKAEVINATVKAGAILRGDNNFSLNKDSAYGDGVLRNEGTISPGNSIGRIVIDGNYTQTASGELHMEFDATESDTFVVKGTVTGKGNKLTLVALPDYYAPGTARVLTNQELFEDTLDQMSSFSELELEDELSPTLDTILDKSGGAVSISVRRVANAYSKFADHKNERQVARALENIAGQAQGDMRELIEALDFSGADGSGVRSGLRQLSPVAHAYAAQASAEANLMLGRMALGQLRTLTANTPATTARADSGEQRGLAAGSAAQNQPQWAAFVAPFASSSSQQSHGSMPGYNSSQAGLMGGVYTQRDALSLGVYTAFARRQMDAWTAEKSQAQGTSLHLGGMATWKPAPTGWHAFAQMQVGVENTDTKRDVLIGSYGRQNKGFSTSFAGTAMLGGGWQWQVDSLTFGPYVGLEYALNMLPQTEEWGGQGTRLNVEAFNRHDLRGVGGVNLAWSSALGNAEEDRQIKATLDAAWRQDLLNTEYTLRSSFVGYGNQRFDTTVQREGQGSLGITGSLQVDVRKDVTLGAHVQTEVLRQDYNALGGGLSLRWEF